MRLSPSILQSDRDRIILKSIKRTGMHLCFQREGNQTLKTFSLCENYAEQHTSVDNFYSFHGLYAVPAMYQAFLSIPRYVP